MLGKDGLLVREPYTRLRFRGVSGVETKAVPFAATEVRWSPDTSPWLSAMGYLTSCTRSYSFLAKNVFCHGNGRHCLWPTSIERQVRNDFLELRFGEAIFFRLLQVKRELLRVAANDGNRSPRMHTC